MSSIDFTDNTTVVPAAWLDDVDAVVYEQTGVGKTTVASATTPDIFAVTTGRLIDYTGTATCTGFVAAVSAGSHRTLYCAGAAVFTAGANLLIDGVASGSNLTCVAGDILDVLANTTTQFQISRRNNTKGTIAQIVNYSTGAYATGATLIPNDDTIPQNTEGDEYLSLAITPKNASSTLIIDVVLASLNSNVAAQVITAALFVDSTANALAAAQSTIQSAALGTQIVFRHTLSATSISARTYKVRAGCHTAQSLYLNGIAAARILGGVLASSITITEILP